MNRKEILLLVLIIVAGFIIRLYRIDNPIADWHSWRQSDTSSVSREFVKNGIDLLHPTYQDLSNIPSGKENPTGFRFVEFPIYNFFQAFIYKVIGVLTLEEWGRIVSIISSILTIIFMFLLVKKYFGLIEGYFSIFFFAFLPFSIYYGRTILPDEMMVMAIFGGIYFFDKWLNLSTKLRVQNLFFFFAIAFTATAFLLKPYALFFTLPMFYLSWKKFGPSFLKKWELWLFIFISITPLIAWRLWMQQYPEGIPASDWLFNQNNIRFKGSFFYWIFAERISKLILGYFGIGLLFLGLLKKEKENNFALLLTFLISSLLYIFVIAGGNVQHDYYQILIIPSICILLSRGVTFLLSHSGFDKKIFTYFLVIIIIAGSLSFSWYYVRDYFNINNWDMVKAGQAADKLLPKDAKVIVPYNGDTSFLYQTNRKGWPAFTKSIEELIKMGANYLVISTPTKSDFDGFGKQYKIVSSSSAYLILKID